MNARGQVQDLNVPFVAGQTLNALTYLDKMVEAKIWCDAEYRFKSRRITIDNKTAVSAAVEAAAGQVEVMCRNIAEGFKELFKLMLEIYTQKF